MVATITCGVFFKGARIGSPKRPLHSIPLANTTNIVESQHDRGCFRENAWAPIINRIIYKYDLAKKLWKLQFKKM